MLRIASLGMTTVSLIKDGFLNPSPYLVYFNPKAIVLQGFFAKKEPEAMLIRVEKIGRNALDICPRLCHHIKR